METVSPAVKVQSPNHWTTREVLDIVLNHRNPTPTVNNFLILIFIWQWWLLVVARRILNLTCSMWDLVSWKWKWESLIWVWLFAAHGLYSPWNSPGQNTGVGNLSFLQGIFPTQGLNPGLPHCRWILHQLRYKGSPSILECVAYSFSRRSSQPRNRTRVSWITGRFFTNWATKEAQGNFLTRALTQDPGVGSPES